MPRAMKSSHTLIGTYLNGTYLQNSALCQLTEHPQPRDAKKCDSTVFITPAIIAEGKTTINTCSSVIIQTIKQTNKPKQKFAKKFKFERHIIMFVPTRATK